MSELKKGLLALALMFATPAVVWFFLSLAPEESTPSGVPALEGCPEGFASSARWYEGNHPEWMSTGVSLYRPDAGPAVSGQECHQLVGRIVSGNDEKILVETLALDGSWVQVLQDRSYTQGYYWIRSEDPSKTKRLEQLPEGVESLPLAP
jgi:hypothetical protein